MKKNTVKFENYPVEKDPVKFTPATRSVKKNRFSHLVILACLLAVVYFYQQGKSVLEQNTAATSVADINQVEAGKQKSFVHCEDTASFGSRQICLPQYEGFKEVLKDPTFHSERNEVDEEVLLAYYIEENKNSNFKRESIFKIFSFEMLKEQILTPRVFLEFAKQYRKQFSEREWGLTEKVIEDLTVLNFDKPVLLKEYSPHNLENLRSFVSLLNISKDGEILYLITIYNISLLDDTIVSTNYMTHYSGFDSVQDAITRNEYLTLRFIEGNK